MLPSSSYSTTHMVSLPHIATATTPSPLKKKRQSLLKRIKAKMCQIIKTIHICGDASESIKTEHCTAFIRNEEMMKRNMIVMLQVNNTNDFIENKRLCDLDSRK